MDPDQELILDDLADRIDALDNYMLGITFDQFNPKRKRQIKKKYKELVERRKCKHQEFVGKNLQKLRDQAELEELRRQCCAQKGEIEAQQAKLEAQQDHIKAQQAEFKAQQAEFKAQQAQLKAQQDQIKALKNYIEAQGGRIVILRLDNADSQRKLESLGKTSADQLRELEAFRQRAAQQAAAHRQAVPQQAGGSRTRDTR